MQQPASRAELAVPLIQFLGLIKRRLDLVKLLRAGIEGVGLVIHLVWDEPPIVPGTGWGVGARGGYGESWPVPIEIREYSRT